MAISAWDAGLPGAKPPTQSEARAVLPHDADAERAVLVVALSTPDSLGQAMAIAPPDVYYDRTRQQIARAVTSILDAGEIPDVTSVTRWLAAKTGKNLPQESELIELHKLAETPYVADAEQHARVIREHWVRRQRISIDQWRIAQHREGNRPIEDVDREADERFAATVGTREPTAASDISVLGAREVFASLPAIPWAIQGLDICPGAPTLVAGYGYSGKSMALQALCLHVAAGMRVWGSFEAKQGCFIHLDWEQGEYLSRLRYQRIAYGYDLAPQDLDGRIGLVCYPQFYLDEPESFPILEKLCAGKSIAVFDSFRAACRHTDENSSEARVPLDMLSRLSERTGCSMLVIHHARKPRENDAGSARDSIRGSGALYDACGSVFVLEGKPEDPERTVYHCKARVSGKTQEPMTLRIEDAGVPAGDGSVPGIRVTVAKAPTADERNTLTVKAKASALRTKILDLFEREPVQKSADAIADKVGAGDHPVRRMLKILASEGQIEATGSTSDRGYQYVGHQ